MKLVGVSVLAALLGGTSPPPPHIYASVSENGRMGVISTDGGRWFYPTHNSPIVLSPDLPEVLWSTLGRKLTVTLLGGPQHPVRTQTQTALAFGTHGRIYYASGRRIFTLGGDTITAHMPTGSISDVSPSPDGLSFAVSTPDLYVVSAAGTTLVTPEIDPLSERPRPVWSPDGSQIAYLSGHELWVVAPDGTGRRQVTHTPAVDEVDVTWSPDSTRLAYTVHGLSYVASLTGTTVSLGKGAIGAWSPDGRQIALIRPPAVVVVPARGGGASRVVLRLKGDSSRTWIDSVSWLKL